MNVITGLGRPSNYCKNILVLLKILLEIKCDSSIFTREVPSLVSSVGSVQQQMQLTVVRKSNQCGINWKPMLLVPLLDLLFQPEQDLMN